VPFASLALYAHRPVGIIPPETAFCKPSPKGPWSGEDGGEKAELALSDPMFSGARGGKADLTNENSCGRMLYHIRDLIFPEESNGCGTSIAES
jgi:hypothetical protein